MTDYTVGFMFNESKDQVVLMKKNRPAWQSGLLNGPGGHINENETAREGMVREFLEETGVETEEKDWQCFCRLTCTDPNPSETPAAMVYFFQGDSESAFQAAKTTEDEEVEKHFVKNIVNLRTVPNLQWLIPLAIHHAAKFPVHVIE